MATEIEQLKLQIAQREQELVGLKARLAASEASESTVPLGNGFNSVPLVNRDGYDTMDRKWPLDLDEYTRYGRQMILPSVGLQGI